MIVKWSHEPISRCACSVLQQISLILLHEYLPCTYFQPICCKIYHLLQKQIWSTFSVYTMFTNCVFILVTSPHLVKSMTSSHKPFQECSQVQRLIRWSNLNPTLWCYYITLTNNFCPRYPSKPISTTNSWTHGPVLRLCLDL
jgi:hypothetical protein